MRENARNDATGEPAQANARVGDRLRQLRRRHFVGRQRELAALAECAEPEGPAVTFLHGMGGIGKSALLEVLEERLAARGIRVLRVDARSFEPTPRGFYAALRAELGLDTTAADQGAPASEALPLDLLAALGNVAGITVLVVDHYELLRLLDAWLRTDFVPRLPARVRLLVACRHPPAAGWSATAGWQTLVQSAALEALSEAEARQLLEMRGAPAGLVPAILDFAQGHPVALELALAAAAERPSFDFESSERSLLVARLARLFLQDLADKGVRTALEAACVVRRASLSFLASILGPDGATQAMEHLGELGFVERTAEGFSLHPSVRQALEGELRALDPVRHRELRRAAWQHMRRALPSVGRAHVWQHAADMLFLLEQEHLREAFFPSGRGRFVVERARTADWSAIVSIAATRDSTLGIAALQAFLDHAPHAVHVARGEDGAIVAFYVLMRSDEVDERLLARDPLLARWVTQHPPSDAPALLLRRILAHPTDRGRAEAYAACVLDLKRSYIENPRTTRLYAAASDLEDHPEWPPLGFEPQPELFAPGLAHDARPHLTFCLNFGQGGIFGWIGRLVDAEYAAPAPSDAPALEPLESVAQSSGLRLDEDLRQLVIDGAAVQVTPLQFNLLRHLSEHRSRVIDRDELVRAVWGRAFVGSNVVDASIRLLRKKLGAHAAAIETVKGFGYRFRG